jgi:hypothetical protein
MPDGSPVNAGTAAQQRPDHNNTPMEEDVTLSATGSENSEDPVPVPDDDVPPNDDDVPVPPNDYEAPDSSAASNTEDPEEQKRKIALASGHRYALQKGAQSHAFLPVPEIDYSGIKKETKIDKEFNSRKVCVDLRYDAKVNDENVIEVVSAVHPLANVTFIDLSWTQVSFKGLEKLLPQLTSLIEISYQSPINLTNFPVSVLPKTLQIVHLDDSNEFILNWDTTAGETLKPFWDRAQIAEGAFAGPNSYFRHVGFRVARVSTDVAKELYRLQDTARSLHLQCNSESEGAWEVPDIEKVLRVLPTQLVDLNLCCSRDRKPQHPRGRSTLSEFLEDPSDPDVLGYIVRSSGKTLERLELNIPHIPKCDLHYFQEMPKLKTLILHGQTSIHQNSGSFPPLKNLVHLEANLRLYPGDAAMKAVCSMTNLVYLDLGSDWIDPKVIEEIGNTLVNLTTLSVNGGKNDVVDVLLGTKIANKLETILSITIEWDWILPHLLRYDGSPNFASLKFISLKVPQHVRYSPEFFTRSSLFIILFF